MMIHGNYNDMHSKTHACHIKDVSMANSNTRLSHKRRVVYMYLKYMTLYKLFKQMILPWTWLLLSKLTCRFDYLLEAKIIYYLVKLVRKIMTLTVLPAKSDSDVMYK